MKKKNLVKIIRLGEYIMRYYVLFVKNKNNIIQFCTFCFVGLIWTGINVWITYYFTDIIWLRYILSATIGQFVGISVNFMLNKNITFHAHTWNAIKQYVFSLLSYSIGVWLYLGLLYILVDFFEIWYILWILITVPIVVLINFITHKFIVFK